MSYTKTLTVENINQLLADYAALSGRLATFIGDRAPSDEEQQMMNRLIEFHSYLVSYASGQTG